LYICIEEGGVLAAIDIRVADEVFIAAALLQQEHPEREDFSVSEIVERATQENIFGSARPGLRTHASQHCVANKPADPGNYRMLFDVGRGRRRLLKAGDEVHPGRTGKMWPDPNEVPMKYRDLIEWAKQRYGQTADTKQPWLASILAMRGMGRDLWAGEDPDEYVRRLREDWD
jgi:hypothetical protein